jgi:hypothetical protein
MLRIYPLGDDFACTGDDPEIASLVEHAEWGTTLELWVPLVVQIAWGTATLNSEYAP